MRPARWSACVPACSPPSLGRSGTTISPPWGRRSPLGSTGPGKIDPGARARRPPRPASAPYRRVLSLAVAAAPLLGGAAAPFLVGGAAPFLGGAAVLFLGGAALPSVTWAVVLVSAGTAVLSSVVLSSAGAGAPSRVA